MKNDQSLWLCEHRKAILEPDYSIRSWWRQKHRAQMKLNVKVTVSEFENTFTSLCIQSLLHPSCQKCMNLVVKWIIFIWNFFKSEIKHECSDLDHNTVWNSPKCCADDEQHQWLSPQNLFATTYSVYWIIGLLGKYNIYLLDIQIEGSKLQVH